MSHDKGNFKGKRNYNKKNKINVGDKGKEVLEALNEDNPVIKQFQGYAAELDAKHDRYERIVKTSRDITIESKRIIFLLHTLDKESKKSAVLGEAETRLNKLIKELFKNIALELDGQDSYLYLRAYRAGLQEFVEAITFYWFLQNSTLYNWTELEKSMTYSVPDVILMECDYDPSTEVDPTLQKTIQTLIPPIEYILGIGDLTGELMRKCINSLAMGDIDTCFHACNFVRNMYIGFLGCAGISGREVGRKVFTLKQSLMKMENVCYMVKVRGSEIPKHMLADVAIGATEDIPVEDDEGYHVY